MQVHVANMKTQLISLNKLLTTYEEDLRNFYNELNTSSSYWQDTHADKFFNNVKGEHLKSTNTQNELRSIEKVYKHLIESYETLGDKIFFDFDHKDSCLEKINTFIEKMRSIIGAYNSLDTSFCGSEATILEQEKQKMMKDVKMITKMKENLQKVFREIEEIEKNIQLQLSKISIELIKETDIEEFIGG